HERDHAVDEIEQKQIPHLAQGEYHQFEEGLHPVPLTDDHECGLYGERGEVHEGGDGLGDEPVDERPECVGDALDGRPVLRILKELLHRLQLLGDAVEYAVGGLLTTGENDRDEFPYHPERLLPHVEDLVQGGGRALHETVQRPALLRTGKPLVEPFENPAQCFADHFQYRAGGCRQPHEAVHQRGNSPAHPADELTTHVGRPLEVLDELSRPQGLGKVTPQEVQPVGHLPQGGFQHRNPLGGQPANGVRSAFQETVLYPLADIVPALAEIDESAYQFSCVRGQLLHRLVEGVHPATGAPACGSHLALRLSQRLLCADHLLMRARLAFQRRSYLIGAVHPDLVRLLRSSANPLLRRTVSSYSSCA